MSTGVRACPRYQLEARRLPPDSSPPVWIERLELDPPEGYHLHSWQAVASYYELTQKRALHRLDEHAPDHGGRGSLIVLWERDQAPAEETQPRC